MVAESVAAKIFKIGSVVSELWPFYLITLWSAFVSITNQRTEGPERHSNVHLMIVVQVAAKLK